MTKTAIHKTAVECPSCGAPLAPNLSRCNVCGADPSATLSVAQRSMGHASTGPGTASHTNAPWAAAARGPRRTPTAVLVASSLALAASVTAGVWFYSSEVISVGDGRPAALSETARPQTSAASATPLLLSPSPDRLRPERTLVLAQTRALEWHKNATLLSIEAVGVKRGVVDTTRGGSITFLFGKPSAPRVGAGAPVSAKQLLIRLANGAATVEQQQAPPTVGIATPQCTFDAAAKMAALSGIPANTSLELRYALEPLRNGPIWTVRVPGTPQFDRNIDADSCAIILRL